MIPMISAMILFVLIASSFTFILLSRRRILRASADLGSLQAFDEIVASSIRSAGADERRLREMSCDFSLADLRRIRANSRELLEKASELREMMTWAQVADSLYVNDLHRGLLRVNSSRAKAMIFSAIEIILGQFVHHTHYHYTYSVAAAYCAEADIVETMADILDEPSACLLRTHLS